MHENLRENPEEMNAEYFTAENLRTDLQAYADAAGVAVKNLSMTFKSQSAICVNGESMVFVTYIARAGVAFGFGEGTGNLTKLHSEIKDILLRKIGIEVPIKIKMDTAYFTKENVLADLQAYADAAKVDVGSMRMVDMIYNKVLCSNGKKINFETYLKNVRKVLGIKNRKVIFEELKRIAGINSDPQIDLMYLTRRNIRADLEAFAKATGIELENLKMNNLSGVEVECQNGEALTGIPFIKRVAVALYCLQSQTEIRKQGYREAEIYDDIRQIAGFESQITEERTTGFIEVDKDYCTVENVRADLQAFADAEGRTLEDLNTSIKNKKKVLCQNGGLVSFFVYLQRAALALGFSKTRVECKQNPKAKLDQLKRYIGINTIKKMDEEYYTLENILADLQSFADAADEEVCDLNTGNKHMKKAKCSNGEVVSLLTYLGRFGVAFGFGAYRESCNNKATLLKELKILAGENYKDYDEMNISYFTKESIFNDLGAFIKETGVSVDEINSSYWGASVVCSNGEKLTLFAYLNRAIKAFEFEIEGRPNKEDSLYVLRLLARIAGIKVEVFKNMDTEYFNDYEAVKSDIKAFELESKTLINEMFLYNFIKISIVTTTGELISGLVYLNRIKKVFGLVDKTEAFNKLLKIANA